MKALIAISTKTDPLNGRFSNVRVVRSSVVQKTSGECFVDLVIQRDGGPYIRVRMDLEGAAEIHNDLGVQMIAARLQSEAPLKGLVEKPQQTNGGSK